MIRRGFWLLTGAALGVTGYRKASRLARMITGDPAAQGAKTRSMAKTVRTASGYVRGAGNFVRDVREGMADYHDLHDRHLGPRLGDQRDRISSGASQRGSLEP